MGDADDISSSSGSMSRDWGGGWPKRHSDIDDGVECEEISEYESKNQQQVLGSPCWEVLWPFLDSQDVFGIAHDGQQVGLSEEIRTIW